MTTATTTAPTASDGGPGAAIQVVARAVAEDPCRPRTWCSNAASRTHVSVCVGDARGCGPRSRAVAQHLGSTTAALLQEGHEAAAIAHQVEADVSRGEDTFAPLLGCDLDPLTRSVTILQAGLPPPLALPGTAPARFLDGGRHAPLGLPEHARLEPVAWALPPETTLLLFTFGLVERRPDPLDACLDRLRYSAEANRRHSLRALVDRIAAELDPPPDAEYTLVGLRATERATVGAEGS